MVSIMLFFFVWLENVLLRMSMLLLLYLFFPVPLTPIDVIIGCSTDSECPDYAACINSACRNPCILSDPCAPNAFCKVIYHTPKCACPAGYLGDPQIECKLPRKNNCSIEIHFFQTTGFTKIWSK